MDGSTVLVGLLWYVVFVISTSYHEAAHAFVALKLGDPTAYEGGQVTLDPLPHIRREPVGMVVVPLLAFFLMGGMIGWASVPYDPRWAMVYPRRAALMSLAGPLANLSLVLVAGGLIRAGLAYGWFIPPDGFRFDHLVMGAEEGWLDKAALGLSIIFSLNLLLGFFNFLPFPPLDGSSAVQLFLSERQARRFQELLHHPMLASFGILFAIIILNRWFFPLVYVPVVRFLLLGS